MHVAQDNAIVVVERSALIGCHWISVDECAVGAPVVVQPDRIPYDAQKRVTALGAAEAPWHDQGVIS